MREPGGGVSVLVCNNYIHRVTRHVLEPEAGYRVKRNQVFLRRGLKIPDGVTVSSDGQWIAISSHHTNDVKVFSTSARLGRLAKAVGILKNANFPHGLRFTADGRYLLVADAGSPVVHVYVRGETWAGTREPVRSAVVLDDKTFARGRENVEEGGPKGIDIDPTGTVVAVTCDTQPLAFYALADFIGEAQGN
jgi:DNA-binding beta-propeller fold protein YncE